MISPGFYIIALFFCSRIIQGSLLHQLVIFIFTGLWNIPIPFLFLMTLTVLRRTGQVFCRMPLNMDGYACCVFMLRQRLWVSRNNVTEIQCPHYILSGFTWYAHKKIGDVSLGHFVKVLFARFLHYKDTAFPFLYYLESLSQACIKKKGVTTHIIWNYVNFFSPCSFVFVILYSCQYGLLLIYLILCHYLILCYLLFAQIHSYLTIRCS